MSSLRIVEFAAATLVSVVLGASCSAGVDLTPGVRQESDGVGDKALDGKGADDDAGGTEVIDQVDAGETPTGNGSSQGGNEATGLGGSGGEEGLDDGEDAGGSSDAGTTDGGTTGDGGSTSTKTDGGTSSSGGADASGGSGGSSNDGGADTGGADTGGADAGGADAGGAGGTAASGGSGGNIGGAGAGGGSARVCLPIDEPDRMELRPCDPDATPDEPAPGCPGFLYDCMIWTLTEAEPGGSVVVDTEFADLAQSDVNVAFSGLPSWALLSRPSTPAITLIANSTLPSTASTLSDVVSIEIWDKAGSCARSDTDIIVEVVNRLERRTLVSGTQLSQVTAASWDAAEDLFWMLETGGLQILSLGTDGTTATATTLESATSARHIAASASFVYVTVQSAGEPRLRRYAKADWTYEELGLGVPLDELKVAHADTKLLLATEDSAPTRIVHDSLPLAYENAMFGEVVHLVSDGSSFGIETLGGLLHRSAASDLSLPGGCLRTGSSAPSISGVQLAWVDDTWSLHGGTATGACSQLSASLQFAPEASAVVGLQDSNVVSVTDAEFGEVTLYSMSSSSFSTNGVALRECEALSPEHIETSPTSALIIQTAGKPWLVDL